MEETKTQHALHFEIHNQPFLILQIKILSFIQTFDNT